MVSIFTNGLLSIADSELTDCFSADLDGGVSAENLDDVGTYPESRDRFQRHLG